MPARMGARESITQFLVILGNESASRCYKAAWEKGHVKEFLYKNARRTVADLKRGGRIRGPSLQEDERTWRHAVSAPDDIILVVAGGEVGHHAACLPGWGLENPPRSVTVPVFGLGRLFDLRGG